MKKQILPRPGGMGGSCADMLTNGQARADPWLAEIPRSIVGQDLFSFIFVLGLTFGCDGSKVVVVGSACDAPGLDSKTSG
jgi:hypothetical protein